MRWRRQNLLGLSRHEPGLAESLAEPVDEPGLELLRTPSGAFTARRVGSQGGSAFMHSSMNPLDQAKRSLTATLPASFKEGRAPENSVGLVLGLGLGWPALAAAALLPASVGLWLADSSPAAFSKGLDCLDLGPLWDRARLRLFFGPPEPAPFRSLASAGALSVALNDAVVDCDPNGREWALSWMKALADIKPARRPDPKGLPVWLGLAATSLMRGELA